MLLLDIAKAFHRIDYDKLYYKMEKAGFGPVTISWFKDRHQWSSAVIEKGRYLLI